ncbi:unnamed protein product [Rangifer tarandus platyrhynchus]|uniref:Uncharacterized protein n=1 Tax=Rangifer tarandus platyrhynchus TaxID=3082113 RepID=A0AC59ZYF1_RANTA
MFGRASLVGSAKEGYPFPALPLLGAAGELLLPLAQLCSRLSLSDFSSPSRRLLSDSLGMFSGSLQAGLEETTE